MSELIDVSNMLLRYAGHTIYIALSDKDNEPWFNGKECAHFFGYSNIKRALRENISPENKNNLKNIVSAYKLLYKNVQGHSIYISVNGFYELLGRSNKSDAREIQKWMYTEVLPQLQREGHYEIDKRLREKLFETNEKYNKIKKQNEEIKNRNKELENNQKKNKYPNGGSIYVTKPNINSNKKLNKIGKSKKNLKNRFSVYNTTVPDDVDERVYIPVEDPTGSEMCLKGLLHRYRYRDRKEYFKCSLKEILRNLDICVFTTEGRHIEVYGKDASRIQSENNSVDAESEELFEFEDDENDEYDEDDTEDIEELENGSDDEHIQEGGVNDTSYELGYYKYLKKNIELLLQIHNARWRHNYLL